jgi:hypothetical protein
LEQALARANVSISRGALANWVIRSADLHLLRLYEALKQKCELACNNDPLRGVFRVQSRPL